MFVISVCTWRTMKTRPEGVETVNQLDLENKIEKEKSLWSCTQDIVRIWKMNQPFVLLAAG